MAYAVGLVCACGVIILIVGIILISVAAPNEVPLWFGVNMCVCGAGECDKPAGYGGSVVWKGLTLAASAACPVNPPMSESLATAQTFKLEQELFSMDGLEYRPVVYRTDDHASIALAVVDDAGKTLMSMPTLQLTNDGSTVNVPQNDAAGAAEEEEAAGDATEANPAARQVMKGGRSAGGPARSRSGAAGRYGSATRVRSNSYGYSSCCVRTGTVVYIHRTGPRSRNGYYDTEDDVRTDCASSSKGCVFEVAKNLNRDEIDSYSIVPTNDLKWPLHLVVSNATLGAKNAPPFEPEMYVTWWTEDPDNGAVASYVLIPLGSVMIVGAIIFFNLM